MNHIFREDFAKHRRHRLLGEVVIAQPVSAYLASMAALCVVALVALLLAFGTFTRSERVRGVIAPDLGVVKLQAPRRGTITSIAILPDTEVEQNQVLLTIDAGNVDEDGSDAERRQQVLLDEQAAELKAQIQRVEDSARIEERRLRERISAFERQSRALRDRMKRHQERVAIARSQADTLNQLYGKGFATLVDVQRREELFLSLSEQDSALRQQQISIDGELDESRNALSRLPSDTQARIAGIRSTLAEIAQRRAASGSRQAFAVRSPVAGRVMAIQASAGQQIQPGVLLLAILPKASSLQVELYIPTRAAGFLKPGIEVRLAYDAFPYEHFGTHIGTVAAVDRTVLSPGEILASIDIREPVYRATVKLQHQSMTALGQQFPLRPGMALTADLFLESRRLYQWMMRPLYAAASAAGA